MNECDSPRTLRIRGRVGGGGLIGEMWGLKHRGQP